MRNVFRFPIDLLAGHAAFNRRPWHAGAPRKTIEDHIVALVQKLRGVK